MPNHVHVLFAPHSGRTVSNVVHSWKSFTAHTINQRLGRTGATWAAEFWDRLIRSSEHLAKVRIYIRENSALARLASETWKHFEVPD